MNVAIIKNFQESRKNPYANTLGRLEFENIARHLIDSLFENNLNIKDPIDQFHESYPDKKDYCHVSGREEHDFYEEWCVEGSNGLRLSDRAIERLKANCEIEGDLSFEEFERDVWSNYSLKNVRKSSDRSSE